MKQLATIALWFVCSMATAQNFTLRGNVNTNDYDGLAIRLVKLHPADRSLNTIVDSARIENGHFRFSFPVETPFLASLALPPKDNYHFYGLPETMCIAEPGNVAISYSASDPYSVTLSGGKLNTDYDATILSRDREVRRKVRKMMETRNAQEQTTPYSPEQEQAYGDSLRSLYASMCPAYHDFIARNISNDVGVSLFFSHQKDFPEVLYKSLKTKIRSDYSACHDSIMKAREIAGDGDRIVLVGGNGGRPDHFVALLDSFSREYHCDVWLCGQQVIYFVSQGSSVHIKNVCIDDRISVSRITSEYENTCMKCEGLEWSELFPKGMASLSNRISKEYFDQKKKVNLYAEKGSFLVYVPYTAQVSYSK